MGSAHRKEPGRPSAWWVFAAWALLIFALLPVREVMSPDEARFTQQAQEMRDARQWFVPTIGEVPNADKPPVLFWSINLASAFLPRVNEFSARVPSAISALVVLLLVMRLGRRLWGRPGLGFLAAVMLLTNYHFFHRAQWVSCDMPLTALSWIAITLWREALFEDREEHGAGLVDRLSPRTKIALGWLACSLGVMTKGLGLFWALFWIVGEAWARRSWRPLRNLIQPLGILLFLLPLGAWLTLFAMGAGPEKLQEAVFHQTVERYVSAWNVIKPWYFYSHQLPVDLLPWTVFLPLVAILLWRVRGRRGERGGEATAALASFAFALIAVVFFSFSTGKRGVYLLPLQPALALLLARAALVFDSPLDLGRRARTAAYGAVALLGLALAGALQYASTSGSVRALEEILARTGRDWILPLVIGCALMGLAGLFSAVLSARGLDSRRALVTSALGVAAFLLAVGFFVGRAANRHQGGEEAGAQIASIVPEDARIAIKRGKFELFLFYSQRKGTEWERAEQLRSELESGRCQYVLMIEDAYASLLDKPFVASLERLGTIRLSGDDYVLLQPRVTRESRSAGSPASALSSSMR